MAVKKEAPEEGRRQGRAPEEGRPQEGRPEEEVSARRPTLGLRLVDAGAGRLLPAGIKQVCL